MDGCDMDTTLRHHVACNRAVDTARKQKHSLAAAAYGKSACALDVLSVNECVLVTNLDSYRNFGIFHINSKMRELLKKSAAQLHAYLRRLHRKCLVSTFSVDLECLCTA